jgi:Mg2+ and Co2+ transporter CorA
MDALVDILKHCEVTTILAIFAGFYIFNGMMNRKFDKFEERINDRFDKIELEIKRLDSDIKELRTSLNRMEGAFYSKECCMLKNTNENDLAR